MKYTVLLTLLVASINLYSLSATAGEDKYPASDFQPTVIFIDKNTVSITSTRKKAVFDPKYPAANFEPKIIYIDKAAAKSPRKKAKFDPKYPAANFEPKLVFPAG